MQADLLFSVCYLIDCPDPEIVGEVEVGWSLFACDDAGVPGATIGSLHESVLETDPFGQGN